MQRLEVSGAVRHIYASLGFKGLNCWTSSSDVSGYHADFHEGYDTVGTGQGRSMACVN